MAHSSRSNITDRRNKRALQASVENLEQREVLTPVISTQTYATTFTANASSPSGTVAVTGTAFDQSAAGFTSVTKLADSSQFGGDMVRIQAGPGGDFGKGVYAISRGAGSNAAAVNTPGVIYRVDPATGKASTFFDLNTMIQKIENDPAASAASVVSASSGLKNWYDISFDPEGYFFGRPAMLVSMADSNDVAKNTVYAIGSDGSLIGALAQFNNTSTVNQRFTVTPTATLVTPVEYQTKVRGLFVGNGTQDTTTNTWTTLFFDANTYRPGQALNQTILPPGVFNTGLVRGPQVGLTASNAMYGNQLFSAFTNLEGGPAGGLPGAAGLSGVEWLSGTTSGLQIGNQSAVAPFPTSIITTAALPAGLTTAVDTYGVAQSSFRRFEDIAFDSFGYFSYGSTYTAGLAGASPTVGTPTFVGSLFVADLSPGLAATGAVTLNTVATNFYLPVPGPGTLVVTGTNSYTYNASSYYSGRIMRIGTDGTMTPFAENFNVSTADTNKAFLDSSFSVTFSADGTAMWVADNDGIWQFASTLSLAGSTTGNIVGLNDLRTLGVPYEGQNTAVAVLDTGVDAANTSFRGRVARGTNIGKRNAAGNIDYAGLGGTAGTGTSTTTTGGSDSAGHGTPVAGVVSQFVPQATIMPINLFIPGAVPGSASGSSNTGNTGSTTTATFGYTSNQAIFKALQYLSKNPYVNDPVRPGQRDRVVGATMAWGTQTSFPTEGQAYKAYPQVVASFKQQLAKIRHLGITTVAAAGQFGTPQASSSSSTGTNNNNNTGTTTTGLTGDFYGMSMPAVLNEVISVGGTTAMPFYLTPNTDPTDPTVGAYPRAFIPVQFTSTAASTTTTPTIGTGQVATLMNGQTNFYSDDILYASNASITTDYMAPAVDVPTFAQVSSARGNDPLVFDEAGTSMSAAVTTGSFAVVTSALNYWINLNKVGATSDAYLTQPVGATTLNFGKQALKDMTSYANPDGVNSILQWTAVPVTYNDLTDLGSNTSTTNGNTNGGNNNGGNNNGGNTGTSGTGTGDAYLPQTTNAYSRIDVGNAIAAIEGEQAIQWLLKNGTFPVIDSNKNGMITASELQYFQDNASAMGMAEAGSMARLLGGTATFTVGATAANDVPNPAGALSRRFNFFDYASDGQLNGFITMDQIKVLAQNLLPSPSSFSIIDRTRASANSYLLDPQAVRNYNTITTLNYNWVYAARTQWQSTLKKFSGFSPAQYGVNKGQNDRTNPTYVLFDGAPPKVTAKAASKPSSSGSANSNPVVTTTNSIPVKTGAAATSTPTTPSATPSASDTQAALLATLKSLASGGLGTPKPTGTTGTPVLNGASNMNQKKPLIANVNQAQANHLAQAKPVKSKNVFQSFADKIGISKFI